MFRVLPTYIFNDEKTGLREKLRLAKVGDFEGIDIDIKEVYTLTKDHSPAYVKGMLDSFNLKAGVWQLPFSLSSDQKVYEKCLEQLEDYARAASYLEAFRVVTFVDSKMLKGNFNFYVERLSAVTEVLSSYGCGIGIGVDDNRHFVSPDITRLLKKIKSGNAGFVFSARSWYISGGEAGELRRTAKDKIIYVLLGDISSENKGSYLPGETGVVNISLFLTTLAEIGYDGPVAPEIPDRDLLTIPQEIRVRLFGGSLFKVWKKAIIERR
ncbi:MAG: TIM barrel protein [Candidatus Ratteibacteria bacterium]|nr:TIM barrel protein [Candidatus Ratteibacteria bacterium]